MRRKDKEISGHVEIEDLLANAKVGRLGTCLDNIPYITPVNFVYDKNKIYFHSALEGRKITNIISNPKVCFEIDETIAIIPRQPPCASTTEYKSVIISGNARFVTDIEEKTYALNKLIEKYAPHSTTVSLPTGVTKRTNVLAIEVKEISAKQSPAGGETVITPSEK